MASQMCSFRSTFVGSSIAFKSNTLAKAPARTSVVVEASKRCMLTNKKRNKANVVTFSNKHTRKWQEPNVQYKKVYWEQGQRLVKLRISTKAIKTIEKNGLDAMAREAGLDLWSLPFEDMRPQRLAYLEQNKGKVPVAVNPRAMKNPKKLAASTKKPKYPVYEEGGKIVWIRPGQEELIFGKAETQETVAPGQEELKVTINEQ